jgi:hypothetical protein
VTDELIVRVEHVRRAGYCMRGARRWARSHGIDWARFVAEGVPAAVLRATGDALARPVIAAAESEAWTR